MTPVVCATSMASAFNVVLNLVCIWLFADCLADLRKVRDRQKRSAQTFKLFRHRDGLRSNVDVWQCSPLCA